MIDRRVADPDGLLDLPRGFSYDIVSKAGDPLEGPEGDRGVTPGRPHGAAAYPGKWGRTYLVQNHEQGARAEFPAVAAADLTYDPGAVGGTTTLLVDRRNELLSGYVSLAGTTGNGAGGATPWGTWLTCEATEQRAGGAFTRDHGYVFEVSPYQPDANRRPEPLTALGRFAHDAVVVDPVRGHLYLTEDASEPDGLLYRFTPRTRRNGLHTLRRGGLLEALSVPGVPDLSVHRRVGTRLRAEWVPVPDPAAATVSIREQFTDDQVTRSRRFERVWWAHGMAYVACSFGGPVWSYDPRRERLELEAWFPAGPEAGVTGVSFSPDRRTLFASRRDEGSTFAVTGPFPS